MLVHVNWLGCVFVFHSLIQIRAMEANKTTPGDCPILCSQSVKVICRDAGEIQVDCHDPKVGDKAQIVWKKKITLTTSNMPGSTTLVCEAPGVWKEDSSLQNDKDRGKYTGKGQENGREVETEKRNKIESPAPLAVPCVATPIAPSLATPSGSLAVPPIAPRGAPLLATPTTPPPIAVKAVPSGFVTVPGFGDYKYINFFGGCEAANMTCMNESARLMVVDSMVEMQAVYKKLLLSELDDFRGTGMFVGVRANRKGDFFTEFGAPFPGKSGIRWASNEPSRMSSEQCVIIDVPSFLAHDVGLGHAANIVCERPLK